MIDQRSQIRYEIKCFEKEISKDFKIKNVI